MQQVPGPGVAGPVVRVAGARAVPDRQPRVLWLVALAVVRCAPGRWAMQQAFEQALWAGLPKEGVPRLPVLGVFLVLLPLLSRQAMRGAYGFVVKLQQPLQPPLLLAQQGGLRRWPPVEQRVQPWALVRLLLPLQRHEWLPLQVLAWRWVLWGWVLWGWALMLLRQL